MIDCQASGKPEPRVLWKKAIDAPAGGSVNYRTVISGSQVQTLVNGSLYFVQVESRHGGLYMCEASNGIGSALSAVIRLTVHGRSVLLTPYP